MHCKGDLHIFTYAIFPCDFAYKTYPTWVISRVTLRKTTVNPFTRELKNYILPTF